MFLIACAIYITGTVIYACFASGEIQPWAVVETVKATKVKDRKNLNLDGVDNSGFDL